HNGSEPTIPSGYAVDTTELSDMEAVLDAEGIERAGIVAHSTGGAIAFNFGLHRPERVKRLILLEPTLLTLLPEALRQQDRAARELVIAQAEAGDPLGAASAFYTRALGQGWETRASVAMLEQVRAAAPMIAAHNRALLSLKITPDEVRQLSPPALFVHGRRSTPVHAAIFARIVELRPETQRLVVEDAGHAMHVSRPAPVNAAILDFLGVT
ncbi:MAG: alpha/beta fold hydrolase, partial [Dehalococcoidia bacterium]